MDNFATNFVSLIASLFLVIGFLSWVIIYIIKKKKINIVSMTLGLVATMAFVGSLYQFIDLYRGITWVEYTKDNNFSVLFPKKFKLTHEQTDTTLIVSKTKFGNKEVLSFQVQKTNILNFDEYKKNTLTNLKEIGFMIMNEDNYVKSNSNITQFKMKKKDANFWLFTQLINSNSYLYKISVYGNNIDKKNVQIFFDSFKIYKGLNQGGNSDSL